MKTISNRELISMSLQPLKRTLMRWILDRQISALDSHLTHIDREIRNSQEAKRELTKDRVNLISRRRGV